MSLMSVEAAPQEYTLNPKGSNLYVTVYKDDSTPLVRRHTTTPSATNLTSSIKWTQKIRLLVPSISREWADLGGLRTIPFARSKKKDPEIRKGLKIILFDRKAVRKNTFKGQLDGETYKTLILSLPPAEVYYR